MATDTDRVRIMLAAKERRGVDEEQQAAIETGPHVEVKPLQERHTHYGTPATYPRATQ